MQDGGFRMHTISTGGGDKLRGVRYDGGGFGGGGSGVGMAGSMRGVLKVGGTNVRDEGEGDCLW